MNDNQTGRQNPTAQQALELSHSLSLRLSLADYARKMQNNLFLPKEM
jgi:hypothetical protein